MATPTNREVRYFGIKSQIDFYGAELKAAIARNDVVAVQSLRKTVDQLTRELVSL